MSDTAIQNNQRIFNTYEANLRDTTNYIEFAGKFAVWLDSDRAFYSQGKPSIIMILMTAYRTIHQTICPEQNLNIPLNTDPYKNLPLVSAYRRLIEILSKYVKYFLNDAVLMPHVQFLLHTVGMQLNGETRPPIPIQPSPIVQLPRAPIQTDREPSRASTSMASSSQSPTPLALPKKKRNLDWLIKQDLDWYAAQKSSVPKSQGDPFPKDVPANEPSSSKSPLATKTETRLVPQSRASPAEATPVLPSESTSTSGVVATPQTNTITQVETKPVSQNNSSTASGFVPEVETKPEVCSKQTTFRDAIPPESRPLSENSEITDERMEEVLEVGQIQEDVAMASPQAMDVDDDDDEREEVANLFDQASAKITVDTDQDQLGSIRHEAEDSGMEDVGIRAGEKNEAIHQRHGDEPSRMPHGRNENAHPSRHSTPADAYNSMSTDAASDTSFAGKPAGPRNVDEIVPQNVVVASPPPVVLPVKEDIVLPSHDGFNHNALRIWLDQGKKDAFQHKFTINVAEEDFVYFVNWNRRNKNAREVEKSRCFSLCCYKTVDLAALIKRGARGLELVNSLRISWPEAGGLKLLVTVNGQQKMVLLAPPTVVTAGLLDLTLFLQVGQNEFTVVQEQSMTEYALMAWAHDPTRAQLEPVIVRRKQEQDWKTVLNHLSRPLELLPGPWD
ncbi:uncharacterized protein BT62DRAFT_989919 [Guyanagaster necrorhizus]|uniref:Uncharacterized protein n=1 Tax=Guyanagaster necrorhizus TaxID=856835 RepID=A0A9P7W624_9AGAR|nr:uncharacterized protein BT62DRAFT_989919 [Guyanagaster necrorhizus MCA 3950]KAG7452894.1 hypothetical protein BT62DRAFT_989919 [Guyanagaster necrorhizus MCA 3950]